MMFTREFLSTMLTRVPLDDSAIYCLPVTKVMSAMIRYYAVSTGIFIQYIMSDAKPIGFVSSSYFNQGLNNADQIILFLPCTVP